MRINFVLNIFSIGTAYMVVEIYRLTHLVSVKLMQYITI
jgi:hypothetical protein